MIKKHLLSIIILIIGSVCYGQQTDTLNKIMQEHLRFKGKNPVHSIQIYMSKGDRVFSAYRLSKDLGIPQTRTSEIIKGNRSITADTAIRLSYYFGNSAKFWLGLQNDFDLEEQKKLKAPEFKHIKRLKENAAKLS